MKREKKIAEVGQIFIIGKDLGGKYVKVLLSELSFLKETDIQTLHNCICLCIICHTLNHSILRCGCFGIFCQNKPGHE